MSYARNRGEGALRQVSRRRERRGTPGLERPVGGSRCTVGRDNDSRTRKHDRDVREKWNDCCRRVVGGHTRRTRILRCPALTNVLMATQHELREDQRNSQERTAASKRQAARQRHYERRLTATEGQVNCHRCSQPNK